MGSCVVVNLIARRTPEQLSHVVWDKPGGVALEPAITSTVADIHAEHGGQPLSEAEFSQLRGDLTADGEG